MAGNFRARRPASPPPGVSHAAPSQRFPHRPQDHLDADERRAEASKSGHFSARKSFPPGGLKLAWAEWQLLIALSIVACGVRLFRLSRPNSVVFDEVHFGKFAGKYIKTQYFVDVHPPLAKLLITLAAFVSGFDGNFDFKEIAKIYEKTPYVAMRMVPASLGVALVPLTYLTLRALDCRATTALVGSLFITFENGLITQSRHILLDSPLIFFTGLSTFFWIGFSNEDRHKPFTQQWWLWLTLCGLSLGAVVSCKWVGLFTIATVGLGVLRQLWLLLGDLRVTPRLFIKHFMARALCLIMVPILFYMAMFEIHFLILQNSGEGDGFMSSEFQHTLGGRGMADTFADVAVGSQVSIRHVNTQGGYLHSHPHNYPGGSKQQQVTLYPHRDSNNDWLITNITDHAEEEWKNLPLTYITSGATIRLQHIATEKRLHSHDVRPPVSEVDFQNEVSTYGMSGFVGDANDNWILEIDRGDNRDKEAGKRLKTLRTHFRLRHALTGCYLFSHKVKLPEWGYEQQEVTCNKNAVRANSLWFVETNTNPKLPENAPKVNYKLPGFISKFLELQQVMWTTNAGLTDRHSFDSRPESWPRLRRGINFWVKDHRQIYLLGNPIIWWLSTFSVVSYVTVRGILILRAKRGFRDFDSTKVVKYDTLCGFLFIGWGLHYFPFFLMGRQLFLHHYFPALYFSILLACASFDFVTSTLRPRVRLQIAAVLVVLAIWNYAYFSPLVYGNPWTKEQCNNAKWVKTWDFMCHEFLDDYSQYSGAILATPKASSKPVATIGGEAGGRAPIVVHDNKPPPANDAEEAQSTALLGKIVEPGYDIFAGADKGIKSESSTGGHTAGGEQEEAKEAKSVSSVVVKPTDEAVREKERSASTSASSSSSSSVTEADLEREPERQSSRDDDDDPATETLAVNTDAQESTEESEGGGRDPEGPLVQDEAEADRVRNEIFADDDE